MEEGKDTGARGDGAPTLGRTGTPPPAPQRERRRRGPLPADLATGTDDHKSGPS